MQLLHSVLRITISAVNFSYSSLLNSSLILLHLILSPFLIFSRWVKQETEFTKQAQAPDSTPKLDLGFKEGQTITLNIGVTLLYFQI